MSHSDLSHADNALVPAPTRLRVVRILALLWNLVGVAMFFLHTRMAPEQIPALPEAQRMVYAAMPAWLDIAYGIAVFAGVFGAVGLLLRRRWAVWLLAVSLLAVLVQMGAIYAMTPAWQASGLSGLPMTLLIIGIAAWLLWFARRAEARRWLR